MLQWGAFLARQSRSHGPESARGVKGVPRLGAGWWLRSRGCGESVGELFAWTPSLPAVTLLVSAERGLGIVLLEAPCAFLFKDMKRNAYIDLPLQDLRHGDGHRVGRWRKVMYRARDAPQMWSDPAKGDMFGLCLTASVADRPTFHRDPPAGLLRACYNSPTFVPIPCHRTSQGVVKLGVELGLPALRRLLHQVVRQRRWQAANCPACPWRLGPDSCKRPVEGGQ